MKILQVQGAIIMDELPFKSFNKYCNSSIKIGDEVIILPSVDASLRFLSNTIQRISKCNVICEYRDKHMPKGQNVIQISEKEYSQMSTLQQSRYRFIRVADVEYSITFKRKSYKVQPEEFINTVFLSEFDLRDADFLDDKTKSAAINYLNQRESVLAEWLRLSYPEVLRYEDWPHYLAEWMRENSIHKLSAYRLKRFSKSFLQLKQEEFDTYKE